MSSNDGGGGAAATSSTGEPLKIIKTQLIPHNPILQQHSSPLSSPQSTTATHTPTLITPTQSNHNPNIHHHNVLHLAPSSASHVPTIQLKNNNIVNSNSFSLNPVAAKITHVKTTTLDAMGGGVVGSGTIAIGSGISGSNTIMTSGSGGIKVSSGGGATVNTSISGTPISINTGGVQTSTTAIRAIGAGGQSTQVRVVMPTGIMPPSMIKQLEGAAVAAGRTQITAIPANARTVSNTSITVTRPVTQTTYLPRAATGVTATQMTGVGLSTLGVSAGQRLVTPIRATTGSAVGCATTMTGLTAAGSFVRGTAVSRNSNSPATTVISPATSTPWMAANTTGQVQLIRAIPQPRQRIITTQGITNAVGGVGVSAATVSGTVVATSGGTASQVAAGQSQQTQSTIQTVVSQALPHNQQQQQTYVATLATVLPPRQHQATLVYSSNVAGGTSQTLSQPQQFNSQLATGQRFAVATPISGATGTGSAPRQIRPIPLGKSFSTAKLNTTSISIRAPNIPQLTPTLTAGVSTSANSPRSTSVTGSNVIPTTNLSTTRIIQLQQQPGGATQQIIGSTGRLAGNVMLQPIIVNTSAGGKLGIRPPVTMAAKVQPSLTITQLGIGKLPGTGNTTLGQQNVTASIQTLSGNTSSSISNTNCGSGATNLSAGAQLVNVSQAAGQLLTTQNIVSSAGGGATVVPLAITTRSGAAGNILTGTITPIKNANGITMGKVMTQAQMAVSVASADSSNMHQRTHSSGATLAVATSTAASSSGGAATSTVLTSSAGSFLPPGSTIYYESVPASSVQVSTGVLSLTTTTATSSTMSQHQIASSGSTTNLSVSSLPFATNSTATFTMVPSTSGGRTTIGHLQIPVSNAGTQIQAVPVRFNTQLTNSNAAEAMSTSQLVSSAGQQILIPAQHQSANAGGQQGQHMVIPLQTSIKVTSGAVCTPGTTVVSNFLRKRDADGSPIRAAKNLGPTLLSMGSSTSSIVSAANSPAASSVGSSYSVASSVTTSHSTTSATTSLTAEALAKKDRSAGVAASSTRSSRADSPASSDGSTTVSANSSPGVDQQIQQDGNMVVLNRIAPGTSDSTHFNPINELYSNHHSVVIHQHSISGTPVSSRNSSLDHQQVHASSSSSNTQRLNGGALDCPQRKKSRRSTNDSQQSTQSQASLNLPAPQSIASIGNNSIGAATDMNLIAGNGALLSGGVTSHETNNSTAGANNSNHKTNNLPQTAGNKENAKPMEFILRRPRNCTLLHTYKQSWKAANNHFQRYTDVKPREERRPTVIDLVNQANVNGKINGWKIYHLSAQMEDLCENESLSYDKLSTMLRQMESHDKSSEIERISDLLKGNMQRSKIIVDGINEAQSQIMKIFEHKSHISDIINRCASKRNFKKREKV